MDDQAESTAPEGGPIVHYERASAALLAQEPNEIDLNEYKPEDGWPELWQALQSQISMLTSWRWSWQQHWALLSTYIHPRRNLWLTEGAGTWPTPNSMIRGFPINQAIVDPTGTQAMHVCASGMMSGLTSPSRPWFKLKPALVMGQVIDRPGQIWLSEVESRMYEVMSDSNVYDSLAQMFEDLVVFGTAPIIVYEDEHDLVRCYNLTAGEYYLAVSPAFRVESIFRLYNLTISQFVEMFGLENCPPTIQAMWQTKGGALETERICAHAIQPNFPVTTNGQEMKLIKGDFAFREVYWVWGEQNARPLSIRGFKESPAFAPRWAVTANDPYGRSPGMDALPDIMQLQVETKRKAEAIEKTVRPPLQASVEMKNQPSSILPGHINYVTNLGPNSGIKSIYDVTFDLQHMMLDIQQIQQRIQKGFFNDLFLMLSQATKDMTAYEVAQRQQEKLQVLGPVIERLQNEVLAPLIKRIFGIMARRRLLPPVPPSLRGVGLKIEYVSMLALAQKAAATAGMERLLGVVGNLQAATQQGPNPALDKINTDVFIDKYADLMNVSPEIMNSEQMVKQVRELRAQAMQKAQQAHDAANTIQNIAQPAVDAAKTLSEINTGGGLTAANTALGTGAGTKAGALG